MSKIKYKAINFSKEKLAVIAQANAIVAEYQQQGMDLTLRQTFYQFVARGLLANQDKEYNRLGDILGDARMAGLVDWDAIVDRTRRPQTNSHWSSPADIMNACAQSFQFDKWKQQDNYIEVWIEKEALVGVIEGVCSENDITYLACRGNMSVSEIWRAAVHRIGPRMKTNKSCTVLYLGDHDPSGIDMTRDVKDRLTVFLRDFVGLHHLEVVRVALNMDQVQLYNPPPNPAKMTDTRAKKYVEKYGNSSWELDALDPVVVRDLIQNEIDSRRDDAAWAASVALEDRIRKRLALVGQRWDNVVDRLEKSNDV